MKKLICLSFFLTAICFSKNAKAQQVEKSDSLGLPGDNLNLYSVLDLFQQSATFEDFEKKLNEQDSKINNLDLNNDGKTDYIKVIDHQDGDSHSTVLQVPINEKENQDIAVIEIDKDKNGKIVLQIVGNEELYGKDYIVEPAENDPSSKKEEPKSETADNSKKSDTIVDTGGNTVINNYNTTNNYYGSNGGNTYVEVNSWPMVHYMYTPTYVVYVSPWHWYYYPMWWQPWSPWYWHDYYWHHHHYYHNHYSGYHRTTFYRAPIANGYYGPRKSVSITVQNHRSSNVYKSTYTKRSHVSVYENKPRTVNPVYNERPEKNTNTIQPGKANPVRENNVEKHNGNRPNSNYDSKPNKPNNNYSKPNKPIRENNKPNKPSKPSENKRSKPNQPKGGGGKKR